MKLRMVLVAAMAATVCGCASFAPERSQSVATATVPARGATCDFNSSERPVRVVAPGALIVEDWGICGRLENDLSPSEMEFSSRGNSGGSGDAIPN